MSNRFAFAAIAASLALTACGSTGSGTTRAQAPISPGDASTETAMTEGEAPEPVAPVKPWAPAPWTGSFQGTAVMLANTFRIEGPAGLLEHVVASSDDAFYDRSVETTPDGLMQVIRRLGTDVPEIRVQVDGWTLAAFDRVTILERIDDSPVRVIASGDALWRDSNGRIAQGQRIECTGEIGDDTPAIPAGATEATQEAPESAEAESVEAREPAAVEAEADMALEALEALGAIDPVMERAPDAAAGPQ
ncbi:hypothetical protein Poly30_33290 [Planctomycetes bacterium Poly30]|uniref:Lipoprotein n=1 Tax=Saltatorellus ferox TaxID=2528018 RepID=A0A518EUM3_9BACT|nr:hypothetical protein Poly30_33290 [Planctomycetes bacterium Poly30]